MPFKPGKEPVPPDYKRLNSTLNDSRVKTIDTPLYEVIKRLINWGQQGIDFVNSEILRIDKDLSAAAGAAGSTAEIISDGTFITVDNETGQLPNSRQLIAGTGIELDDSVSGQLTINCTVIEREWSVLTDGDLIEPELIFAGGDVIMTHIP